MLTILYNPVNLLYFLFQLENSNSIIACQEGSNVWWWFYQTAMDMYINSMYGLSIQIFLNVSISSLYSSYHARPTNHHLLPGLLK